MIGEQLKEAAANTFMGMGTVFAVLIFISLMISELKFIPVLFDKLKGNQKNKKVHTAEITKTTGNIQNNDLSSDIELVAVIAAAIAADEHESPDSFIVRSIRRR